MDLRDLTYAYYVRRRTPKALPSQITEGTVIEVGAGLDNYSSLFPRESYTAVDLDPTLNTGAFRFVRADINDLPFPESSFDNFIASNVLEHVAAPEPVLKRLHSICRKGGLVIVPVNGMFPFLYDPVNWIRKRLGLKIARFGIGGFGHVSLLTGEDWLKIFQDAGFVVTRQSHFYQDVWACAEFFLYSIFFSRNEYVQLCKATAKTSGASFAGTIIQMLWAVVQPIYWVLHKISWRMGGYIGTEYLLAKRVVES